MSSMYVTEARFKVVTDHKPLESVFNNTDSKPPIRVERYVPTRVWLLCGVPSGESQSSRLGTDDYSRYPVVERVTTISVAAVVPKLKKIFSIFGIPEECKSGNAPPPPPPVQGQEFAEFARTQGFKHRKITPWHPEANGEVERFVKTLQKFIATRTTEGDNWKVTLPSFICAYTHTHASHTTTGRGPYSQLFGGREMQGKIPQLASSTEEDLDVRMRDAEAKYKMKLYADEKAKRSPVRQEKGNKLSTPFEVTPYTVCQKKGTIVTAERTTDRRMVTKNMKDLKTCPPQPFHPVEPEETRTEEVESSVSPASSLTAQSRSSTPDERAEQYLTRERKRPTWFNDYICV